MVSPLLDLGLFEKIAAAKRVGCVVSLPSNMTLMDESRALRIVELGVDLVTVSLDAATADTYEQIRRGAKFDRVIANTRRLCRIIAETGSLTRVVVLLVIQKANLFEYNEALELQRELQIPLQLTPVRYLEWSEISAACKPSDNEMELLREQIEQRMASESDESTQAFLKWWLATAQKISTYNRPGRVCLKPWTTSYITAEGEVYPCCLAVSADKTLLLGNVMESSFRDVWHGDRYVSLRRGMLADRRSIPICGSCNVEEAGLQRRFTSWFWWLPNRLRRAWPAKR